MLRWIIAFSVLCAASAIVGFGKLIPVASSLHGVCLTIFALSAVLLIGSFEAYESRAASLDGDDR